MEIDFVTIQITRLREMLTRIYHCVPYYHRKLEEAGFSRGQWEKINSPADLVHLPCTHKSELRSVDINEFTAVPEEEIVRIHSSSGTTGKPIIIPYTVNDINIWTELMARCLTMAGVTPRDRVQITPGYGLWTAGIGFQAGVEKVGAMAIPTGPGHTEKQIEMMLDLKSTVLIGTSSYGLFLAEEVSRRGINDQLSLRLGIFGSERWGEAMRRRIEQLLNIESYDIYGLTEVYGPGIAIDCPYHQGLHFWADHLLFEIIDPNSGEHVPPGTVGELVITTLTKEGMPLLRYRTHDLTRFLPDPCPCGSPYPRIDRILGRTDDMIKIKGVNIYPGQIDELLRAVTGTSSEYQVILTRNQGRDYMLLRVEYEPQADADTVASRCRQLFKNRIGITINVEAVPQGTLPRSEKKTKRIFDYREEPPATPNLPGQQVLLPA